MNPSRAFPVLCVCLFALSCGGSYSPPAPTPPSPTTFDLSGRVTEAPHLGTRVIAGARLLVEDGPNAGRSTTTGTDGTYSMTGLQPSGFTVAVSASGYVPTSRGVVLTENMVVNFGLLPAP